jgi:excisionase family DNA binding protein
MEMMTMTTEEKMLTTLQVAAMLGTSRRTVLRAVKRKGLRPARLHQQYRFTMAMAAALLDDADVAPVAVEATPEK